MQARSLEERRRGIGGLGRRLLNVPELGVGVAIVVFFLLFTALNSSMAAPDNLVRILTLSSYIGIISLGMSLLMLAGEIDLSVGYMAGLAAAVCAALVAQVGWPEWASILAACGYPAGFAQQLHDPGGGHAFVFCHYEHGLHHVRVHLADHAGPMGLYSS